MSEDRIFQVQSLALVAEELKRLAEELPLPKDYARILFGFANATDDLAWSLFSEWDQPAAKRFAAAAFGEASGWTVAKGSPEERREDCIRAIRGIGGQAKAASGPSVPTAEAEAAGDTVH